MPRQGPAHPLEPTDSPLTTEESVSRPVRLPLGKDSEIAAGVHEVQNALASVLGWVEIARATEDPETSARALRVIETGVRRAVGLMSRLADPMERFAVAPRAFRVASLVREVHELLHPRCAAASVQLFVDAPASDDDLVARGDPDRVVQIVTNLTLNAIDAVLAVPGREPPRGRVELALLHDEQTISIRVRDDGTGIDDATRGRLFEPFFTTHPHATGRRKAGSGLGLAVSRALAEAMAGSLSISSSMGMGTDVLLTLPRDGLLPSMKPPADAYDLARGTRVLVVDDEPAIRELLEVALALRGAEVVTAASLQEARIALAQVRFDVLLIDESLGPNESGATLVLECVSNPDGPACALMTGAPSVEHLPPVVAQRLMRKPFSLDDVVRWIESATQRT